MCVFVRKDKKGDRKVENSKKKNFYYASLYSYEGKYFISLNDEASDELELSNEGVNDGN